jgi:hypothetical protein
MIAEGILTTYEINDEISSNYKGFDRNMKWVNYTPEDKKMSYEDVLNTFGYVDRYLYKAMKIEDFGYAIEQGYITQEALENIINKYMRQDGFKVIPPKNSFGQYLWMVTTSDMDDPSALLHQVVEGSVYIVPTPENEDGFMYWYNHSDNKYYNPGDVIVVDSSMYLQAIYGEPEVAAEVIEPEESTEEETEEISVESVEEELQEEIIEPEETNDEVIAEETTEPEFWEIIEDPFNDTPEDE